MPGDAPHISTTRSDTRTVTIEAPASQVFAFVADPKNLPRWAVGFCRAIRPDVEPDRWILSTGEGEMPIRYVTNDATGTIDLHFSPVPGIEVAAYSRVLPNGAGAEYLFTQFQSVAMSDEVFDRQVRALVEELQVLRGLIQARATCPT